MASENMKTPINNESVVQQVINKITDAILVGELKPGDKLPPELEMISTFCVSRNSLRSALQTLRAYGVLEVRRPEGTFVCSGFSPQILNPMLYSILLQNRDTANDLMGLRHIIDSGISALILKRGLTSEEVEYLEGKYAHFVELLLKKDYDIKEIVDADMAFHRATAETSHNSLAVMLHDFLLNLTTESRIRTVTKVFEDNNPQYLVDTHRQYLDALEGKPGADIEEAIEFSYYYSKNAIK